MSLRISQVPKLFPHDTLQKTWFVLVHSLEIGGTVPTPRVKSCYECRGSKELMYKCQIDTITSLFVNKILDAIFLFEY